VRPEQGGMAWPKRFVRAASEFKITTILAISPKLVGRHCRLAQQCRTARRFKMAEELQHRKLIRHFHTPGDIHELTFSCYQRRPLLTNDVWRGLLAESINRAMEGHRYRLTAFVFMPEHVHLLIYPIEGAGKIDAVLKAIKRPYSYRIKQLLIQSRSGLLKDLTICQRPGRETFRYWQEGPGYDRNITEVSTALAAIDYIHLNPVRRRIALTSTDWRWSSTRFYASNMQEQDLSLPTLHPLPAEWLNNPR
jgi:putative transposase